MPRSRPPPKKSTLPAVIPKPQTSLNPIPQVGPSFGQLIKEGIGFGAGQAIAHRAVAAVLGSTASTSSEANKKCVSEQVTFETCLKTRTNEDQCNNEMLSYKQCLEFN